MYSGVIMWKLLAKLFLSVSAIIAVSSISTAAAIDGLYLRKNNLSSSQLRVFDCGSGKGIKIEQSTHKPSIGKVIMCDARPNENGWVGKILNLEDGKQYSATISNSGTKLKIRGCIIGGVLCQNQFLPRVQ